MARQTISEAEIEAVRTSKGGWNKAILNQWGVPYPPPKGWKKAILTYGVPLFDIARGPTQHKKTPPKKAPAPVPIPKAGLKPPRTQATKPVTGKDLFYKSWEWRTLRMQVLKESDGRCQCCGAGRNDLAMSGEPVRLCVDHIKPISRYWSLRLEKTNLQILCDECNQGKGAWDETDWRVAEAIQTQLRYTI